MNNEQTKAAAQLKRSLNRCGKVGLSGGVYDGSFCLWPEGVDPHSADLRGGNFFHEIENKGIMLSCDMHLDGGAGV